MKELFISIHAPRKGSDELSLLLNIIIAGKKVSRVAIMYFLEKSFIL